MRFRSRITGGKAGSGRSPRRLHLGRLKSSEMLDRYQHRLNEALGWCNTERCNNNSAGEIAIEETWRSIKKALTNTASAILGFRPRRTREEWLDHECIEKVEKKNSVHKTYLERLTRTKQKEYEETRREAKRIFRSKKRKYLKALVLQEQDFKRDNLREAYRAMNLLKKGYISRSTICRNKERAMVADKKKILNRWRE